MTSFKVTAVVPSAGKGARFKSKEKKIFANLGGKPLLSYTLKALQSSPMVNDIVLVVDRCLIKAAERLLRHYGITKAKHVIRGGRTRIESVRKGLRCADKNSSLILIHDGVRPFASKEVIERSILAAKKFGASVTAVPVKATIKFSGKNSFVRFTPNRKELWEAQTPQVFKRSIIEDAYRKMKGILFTDDAALVENSGRGVKIVRGDYRNIKITTTEDIRFAEVLLHD